jgi:hypothetical protein
VAERRESVRLDMTGDFTTEAVKAAAVAALLDKRLDKLSKITVRVDAKSIGSARSELEQFDKSAVRTDRSINQLTGRLRLWADAIATIGPAFAPIGALAVPAVAGLASQAGFAAIGMSALVVASQGVGDAFEAVVEADLEPTVENLEAARVAMQGLSPAAREFVSAMNESRPMFREWRDAAATGLFPGTTDALLDLEKIDGLVTDIFTRVGTAAGGLNERGGDWLIGDEGREFLRFVRDEAPRAITELGLTLGSLGQGLTQLWMGFAPLNRDFSQWMLSSARAFDEWATNLSQTDGFAEFVAYVRESGPQVAAALGAIANAVLQIAEAASPLGGPVLRVLETFADIVASIADSNLGTPILAAVAAMSALSRATAVFNRAASSSFLGGRIITPIRDMGAALTTVTSAQQRASMSATQLAAAERQKAAAIRAGVGAIGRSAAVVGGLALATSGAAEGLGVQNTATLALMGTMAGPWGAVIGGGIGFVMDLAAANREAAIDVDGLSATLNQQTGAITQNTREWTAARLEQEGVLSSASKLGLDLKLVTDAALGNADAMSVVNAELDRFRFGAKPDGMDYETEWAPLGIAAEKIGKSIGGSNKALREGQAQTRRYAEAVGGSSSSVDRAAAAARRHEAAVRRQNAAIRESRAAARETARGFITLGDSLSDAEVSLRGWLRQLERQAEALRDFRRNAETAANRGLRQGLIAALQEAGPEGALRMRQLANATQAEIGRANRAWGSGQREVRAYTNEIGGVPREVNTDVAVDTGAARNAISDISSQLRAIPDEVINIYTVRRGPGGQGQGYGVAGGGELRGGRAIRRAAYGSMVPKTGLPYADRHPYLLADGEHIITNRRGEADRNREALEAANRGATLAIAGYANGGEVRPMRSDYMRSPSVNVAAPVMRFPDRLILETDMGPMVARVARSEALDVAAGQRRHDEMMADRG